MIDEARERVLASFQGALQEDGATRVDSGSLWLDTAAYDLAPGVRAFGLDFTSGYMPHCSDGDVGAQRTLYVQSGSTLRPVLSDQMMSNWRILQRHDRCGNDPGPNVIDYEIRSISVAPTLSNGWHDLILTSVSTHEEDERSTFVGRTHQRLSYDGTRYRSDASPGAASGAMGKHSVRR